MPVPPGASFYAATLSPAFRVKKISVEDIFPFGVSATVSRGANSNCACTRRPCTTSLLTSAC